jgi:Cu+-exporting ATPase
MQNCFHCGNDVVKNQEVLFDEKSFCCTGCKTVYEIFSLNDMSCYYDFEKSPGATPTDIQGKYHFLDQPEIVSRLLDFEEESTSIVTLYIPHIHCSSCIWILENLQRLQSGISYSQVNFPEKKVRITFQNQKTNLKEIVTLLCSIGYEPYISLRELRGTNGKD